MERGQGGLPNLRSGKKPAPTEGSAG